MSNKELTPDDSERARKETDGLKDELEKACGEKEVNNKNNRQDYTKELEKLRTTDSENSRKALEEEALVLEQLREIKLKKAKADLLQAQKKIILLRLKRITMFAPLVLGLLILLLPLDSFYRLFSINYNYANLLAVLLILISIFGIMLAYLQTGFQKIPDPKIDYVNEIPMETGEIKYKNENKNEDIKNTLKLYSSFKRETEYEIYKLRAEITKLKHELDIKSSDRDVLSTDNKNNIVDSLKAKLLSEASQLTALEILNNINEKVSRNNKSDQIDNIFNQTLERLKSETTSLGRRGNLNLSLGIITTIIGLSLLGFFVFETKIIPEDKLTFITSFIPRLSLVILIEIFAYFFLKLYKSSLSEIKYFQNEMTNIEAKYAAIQCAKFTDDKNAFSSAIAALTATERNALLEKGQTTAEIEMAKIESKNISVISEKVMKFIKNKNDDQ